MLAEGGVESRHHALRFDLLVDQVHLIEELEYGCPFSTRSLYQLDTILVVIEIDV